MSPAEVAAILSSVVFEGGARRPDDVAGNDEYLPANLVKCKRRALDLSRVVAIAQRHCGLTEPVEDFLNKLRFDLAEVVYEWAKGTLFADLTILTDIPEGIIVRCIQRVDEMLRNVKDAGRVIGVPALQQKMDDASRLLKRDIVFAASLYTQ